MKPEPAKPPTAVVPEVTTTTVVQVSSQPPPATPPPPTPPPSTLSLSLLHSLQEIRRRLELAESGLTNHLHVPLGENSVHECTVHIENLQVWNFKIVRFFFAGEKKQQKHDLGRTNKFWLVTRFLWENNMFIPKTVFCSNHTHRHRIVIMCIKWVKQVIMLIFTSFYLIISTRRCIKIWTPFMMNTCVSEKRS